MTGRQNTTSIVLLVGQFDFFPRKSEYLSQAIDDEQVC